MSLKSDPITVRATAALPAAGAYDTSPTVIDTTNFATLELRVTYARGGAGGSVKFKVQVASDATQGTFFTRTVDDGTINASGSSSYSNIYQSEKLYTPAGAGAESYTYIIDVSDVRYVKIPFAEAGNVGAPGIVTADCVLGEEE